MTGAPGPALRWRTSHSGPITTVALAGELDLATAGSVRSCLRTALQRRPPPRRLVLDLAELEFLDASGVSALLTAQRAMADLGGEVVLRAPSRLVRRVVKVLDLEQLLPLES